MQVISNSKVSELPNRDVGSALTSVMSYAKTAGASGPISPTAQVTNPGPPARLTHFQTGIVGYLQWLSKAQPKIFAALKKQHPDLFTRAQALVKAQGQVSGTCPGIMLSGLGSISSDVSSWFNDALSYTSKLVNLYGTVKQIQNGTTQQVQAQVQQQIAQTASGQKPVAYNVPPTTPPPSAAAVTSPSSSHTGMVIGIGAVAAFLGLKFLKR